jgi:hypothetical protein
MVIINGGLEFYDAKHYLSDGDHTHIDRDRGEDRRIRLFQMPRLIISSEKQRSVRTSIRRRLQSNPRVRIIDRTSMIKIGRWFGSWWRLWTCGVSSSHGFGRHHDWPFSAVIIMVVITSNTVFVSPPFHPEMILHTWACFCVAFPSVEAC